MSNFNHEAFYLKGVDQVIILISWYKDILKNYISVCDLGLLIASVEI